MTQRPLKRIALLLPVWGLLLATLFAAMPKGRVQAQSGSPYRAIQVAIDEPGFADEHFELEEMFLCHEAPEQILHHARRFYCRQRAIPPVLAVVSSSLINARVVQCTGRYVLRHTAAPANVPLSSQYDYLFLLTPF